MKEIFSKLATMFFAMSLSMVTGSALAGHSFYNHEALMTFDCEPGPGYMHVNITDSYLRSTNRTIWASDGTDDSMCEIQADQLRSSRSLITKVTNFAVCYGNTETDAWYLKRYVVNQFGSIRLTGTISQASKQACLENSLQTNSIL